jgi:hypothetical protein
MLEFPMSIFRKCLFKHYSQKRERDKILTNLMENWCLVIKTYNSKFKIQNVLWFTFSSNKIFDTLYFLKWKFLYFANFFLKIDHTFRKRSLYYENLIKKFHEIWPWGRELNLILKFQNFRVFQWEPEFQKFITRKL